MRLRELKLDMITFARRSLADGLVTGTSGNFSVLYEPGVMLITPSGMDYNVMFTEDIVMMKLDGEVLEGAHKPSSEWPMHAYLYRNMPEIGAVVHTHSPYATSFAVVNKTVPVSLIEMVPYLGGDLQVAPFAMPGSEQVGVEAHRILNERYGCLLQNHGVVTVGADIAEAYTRAIYAEDASKIYHLAQLNGVPTVLPEEYIERMRSR